MKTPVFFTGVGFFFILTGSACTTIDPVAFHPADPPALEEALLPNTRLERAESVGEGIPGPESLDFNSRGDLYSGTEDGWIVRIKSGEKKFERVVFTGGRPLGVQFGKNDTLYICDSYKGLLAWDEKNGLRTLSKESEGLPFKFTDDLDIARDGKIYFSDASSKFSQDAYLYDLLESRPHGRLLVFDPVNSTTKTLLSELYFANGVALSKNEDFVLINETYRYRVRKFWLKGPKKGSSELFVDNLPGFPDNITRDKSGNFYLALFTIRNPQMDSMHPKPWQKSLISNLPKFFWPKPQPYGLVLKINSEGKVLESFHDPSGKNLKEITHAQEYNGFLYFGSLHNPKIGKLKL
jgi:sugar lactone lactonase YvrE